MIVPKQMNIKFTSDQIRKNWKEFRHAHMNTRRTNIREEGKEGDLHVREGGGRIRVNRK